MASVHDIMTRQLFSLWPGDAAAEALDYLRMLNIHAAPVLDEQSHEPIGVVSIGDLTGGLSRERVSDRMSSPVRVTIETAAVHEAAQTMAETGLHHLVVVDNDRRAVGFLSVIDVVKALLHPSEGAEKSPVTVPVAGSLEWSDHQKLSASGLLAAPDGPGVFVLLKVDPGRPEVFTWVEESANVRQRLESLLSDPPARLARFIEADRIRFRAATAESQGQRAEVLREVVRRSTAG
ncbi:MAG: CBS domain-containing protein [Nannocystales bacterium]